VRSVGYEENCCCVGEVPVEITLCIIEIEYDLIINKDYEN
jgi:hypothetical protein